MRRGELCDDVLQRRAIIYVRQSTGAQVHDNLESQRRQYELADFARTYGFRDVVTIDDDLGRSASGLMARPGFEALVAQLCEGTVGAVFCLEASRLARNGRDWHHMLELCGLVRARVIDLDGVYDPSVPNDRLLLGLKGTMSEFELTLMRRRLVEGIEAKAQRGEYRITVPVGYLWTRETGLEMDPDRRVQDAIRTVFRLFDRFESARQAFLHMVREGLCFPRPAAEKRHGPPWQWLAPVYRNIIAVLQNPFYAGAYAYGKSTHRTTLVDGRLAKTYGHDRPMAAWRVLLRDHHAGYISWPEFERNQERLRRNAFRKPAGRAKAGRGGRALLAGILRCRRCGRMLQVAYTSRGTVARYLCRVGNTMHGVPMCIGVGARRPDELVATEVLRIVEPLSVEAALAARDLAVQQATERRRALELECEQARYAVQLALRRYEAVDPDNRLVASELEARWNAALAHLRACEARLDEPAVTETSAPDRETLLRLAVDLRAAWDAPTADARVKQQLVRTLVEEILVDVDETRREVVLVIHWRGGQHSEVRARKPKPGEHRKRTSAEAEAVIREMAGTWSDAQMATALNRMGIRTGQGQTWTADRVEQSRRTAGIRAYAPAVDRQQWLTMRDAAKYAGISHHFVRALITRGVLHAKQVVPDAPWQIRRADLDSDAVRMAIARRHSTGRPREARGNTRTPMFPGLERKDAQ
jgi:DNA invertase Pin-like site-specific DNA recombinase